MVSKLVTGAVFAMGLAMPVQATSVFSDGFNLENGGAGAQAYNGFANFDVTHGAVDLIGPNTPGCFSGSCVMLRAQDGVAGRIVSQQTFSFLANDRVTLSFTMAANSGESPQDIGGAGISFVSPTRLVSIGHTLYFTPNDSPFPFVTGGIFASVSVDSPYNSAFVRTLYFRAAEAGSISIAFSSNSANNVGILLDQIGVDVQAVPEPSQWAMLIGGFALIGLASRRRAAFRQIQAH